MSLLFAAVAASAVALLELSVGPFLRIGEAQPHLVLAFGVVWTVAAGVEGGLTWAFVGGLLLDVLAQRPLGSSAFALLLALGAAGLIAAPLTRIRPIAPVVAAFAASLIFSLTLFVLLGALGTPPPVDDPVSTVLPGAVFDTVLAAAFGPLAIAFRDRRLEQERADW